MIVLVRFCWKFSTENKKESEKKMKMRDSTKKKGGLIKGTKKVPLEMEAEEPPKTNERLVTPKKTASSTTF
jgi:hypothetical protein